MAQYLNHTMLGVPGSTVPLATQRLGRLVDDARFGDVREAVAKQGADLAYRYPCGDAFVSQP